MGFGNYLDLRKSYPFYGSYHHNDTNKAIHVLFVPIIFSTALRFANSVPFLGTIPDAVTSMTMQPQGKTLSMADITVLFYASTFVIMQPVAGCLYLPVLALMHHVGTVVLADMLPLAIALHLIGWICQFIGHGVFEQRKPALVDNLFQSIHASVFFVWIEALFMMGWNPSLEKELDGLIKVQMAKNAIKEKLGQK